MSSSNSAESDDNAQPTDNEFYARLDANALSDAIDAVTPLVDECKIRYDESGISITAVDPANVGMVDLSLPAEAFRVYETGSGVLGVDLSTFTDVLSLAQADDVATLDLSEDTQKLVVTVGDVEYTLSLINPDTMRTEPDIPELELPATVNLEGAQVSQAITAADMISEHLSVTVRPAQELYIEATGDTDSVDYTLTEDDLIDCESGENDVTSLFSLDYFKSVTSAAGNSTDIQLRCGDNMPTKLNYTLADGDASVLYMLAPRLPN